MIQLENDLQGAPPMLTLRHKDEPHSSEDSWFHLGRSSVKTQQFQHDSEHYQHQNTFRWGRSQRIALFANMNLPAEELSFNCNDHSFKNSQEGDGKHLEARQMTACPKISGIILDYRVDYEGVLHGVARLLHVPDAFKLLLVIFAVYVLILHKQEVDFIVWLINKKTAVVT